TARLEDWIYSATFSPNGKTLAAGTDDDEVMLWDVVAAKPIGALPGHNDTVRCVAFSPDGKALASSGEDGVIKLWDLTRLRQDMLAGKPKSGSTILAHNLTGHVAAVTGLAFSPDGAILASSSRDTTVLLWDIAARKLDQAKTAPSLEPQA